MSAAFKLARRAVVSRVALAALAVSLAAIAGPGVTGAFAASTANTALINEDSITTSDGIEKGGEPISLEQFAAENAGFKVTVVSGATWDAMTAEEFAHYQVLIVGDPNCSETPASANSNAGTWAPVVMGSSGNRTLVGTDPEDHYQFGGGGAPPTDPSEPATAGAEHLVQDGIAFAGAIPGATGAYYDTSCEDPGTDVSVLDQLTSTGPGHWSEDTSPPCGGSVQQIAQNSAFDSGPTKLLDSDIQGWECSDHITFPAYPADWTPLAVATDTATHPTCGTDPTTEETACGEAYVLVSGTGIVARSPNISLTPEEGSDPAGGTHAVTATVVEQEEQIEARTAPGARPLAAKLNPVAGAVVSFAVSGQNNGVAGTCTFPGGAEDPTCETDANGQVVFTYADVHGAGADTISASVTLERAGTQHATAQETWIAPPAPATPPPASPPAAAPVTSVLATKAAVPAKGSARTASVRGCVAQSGYLASVRGSSIASVTFTLDGHKIKTLSKPTSHGAFALRISLRAGSTHHLAMHVVFTASSKTAATTLRRTLARCAVRALPRFTG
ncbi:MAG TPA: hypothetical protein VES97_10345 [Solirubrobacteraceae bacterium]|nr:hypothetical protein [Solirubrobacteraceae bacterium]